MENESDLIDQAYEELFGDNSNESVCMNITGNTWNGKPYISLDRDRY